VIFISVLSFILSWVPSEGKASECIRWWQRYFGMPSIPLFEKAKKPKKKAMDLSGSQRSQLSSFQVNHNCCATESSCTSHQPNMNRRYPTPGGKWCQLLWQFCHFSIQTRIFDVQLQHLTVSIQFWSTTCHWTSNHRRQEMCYLQPRWLGMEHCTSQISVCCQQHSVAFIVFILHRTIPV
jgi:hypothetical protein